MANEQQSIELAIRARYEAANAIGQAIADQKRLGEELKNAKAAADGSAASIQRLGQAALAYREAQNRLREAMNAATGTTNVYKQTQQELVAVLQNVQQSIASQVGPLGQVASSMASVLATIGPTGAAIGALTVLATGLSVAIIAAAKASADWAEKNELLKDRTGFTTRELAGLKEVAVANGRSFEEIQPALDFFVRKIGEASRGNQDAVKSFADLGVEIRDQNGEIRSTGSIYEDVGEKIRGLGTASERSASAFDLFGRQGSRSVGILTSSLNEAADAAQRRGSVLNPETEATLVRLDAAFDSLAASVDAVKLQLIAMAGVRLEPVVSTLDQMLKKFQEIANDPKVRVLLSLFGDLDNVTTAVGTNAADAKIPGSSVGSRGIKASGLALSTPDQLDIENRNRLRIEQEFNEGIKKAKDQREASEKANKEFFEQMRNAFTLPFPGPTLPFNNVTTPAGNFQLASAGGGFSLGGPATSASKQIEDTEKSLVRLGKSFGSTLSNALAEGILHAKDLGEALTNVFDQAIEQLLSIGIGAGLKAVFPFLQSGGVFLQSGGYYGPRSVALAQGGLVVSGTRGVDSQRALIGRGEAVLSHGLTDSFARILGRLDDFISKVGDSGTTNNYTLNVPRDPGPGLGRRSGPSRTDFKNDVADNLFPVLRDLSVSGAHR